MKLVSILATLLSLTYVHAGSNVPLTNLTDPKARCMDGTLSGYYYEKASTSRGTNKWVIYLEGGGECTTQTACESHLHDALGSSKYFASSVNFDGAYYASDNQSVNPDFWDWNHVYVPYCSQDLHSGMVTQPSNNTYNLYFSGHFVFEAIIDALVATANLNAATEIILTGASAGGIGVWMNVYYLQMRFPNARIVAAPIAGFYFYAYPYQGINHTSSSLADFRPAAWPVTYALWNAYVDEDCAKDLASTPWACMLSNNSFPYITSESFAVEAQTDQVVLVDHDWVPQDYVTLPPEQAYLTEWHNNMTIALSPLANLSNTKNGIFNPACFIHTTFNNKQPLINNMNYYTAFGNWYYQRTAPNDYKLADTCGIMCNPTCP